MKKLIPFILCCLFSMAAFAQTATFTLTTAPCNNDGVLTANFTGLTPPLTVTWTTMGLAGTAIVHSGVTGLSDALTSYSGGPISIIATGGGGTAYNYYSGMPPFYYSDTVTNAICPGLGSVHVAVTGGTAPYTYNFFNAATFATVGTTNPLSLPAGAYGVTITDATGCVYGSLANADSGFSIYSVATFSVTTTSTVANCTDGTATVTGVSGGTAPYSYLWSTGSTASGLTGLVMGSYSCAVTDALGCTSTGYTYVSQAIFINAPVTATPATCVANDGAVIAFGSGGMPPYTYLWSNGATTPSQTGLTSDYYNVIATDANGCTGYGGHYVSTSTPITVTYTSTASSCTSPTGTAHVVPTGGTAPYTITWYTSPVQTGATATALAAGTYGFHIVDAVGCIRDGSVVVDPIHIITATNTSTDATCLAATGALAVFPSGGTAPYTYSWSTGATTAAITGLTAGYYTVSITDASSCHLSKYFTVNRNSPVGVGISSTNASCIFTNDGHITASPFGGTTPYTYSWSTGGNTPTISSLGAGHYYLNITDAVGCTAYRHVALGYNPTATSCYCTISGTIYADANSNCTQDIGEAGIAHVQVYCSGIGYTYTDATGYYSFIVPSGSYTITESVLAFYPLASCQTNNIPVTVVASSGCVHTVDFANGITPIHDVHVSTWDYNWPVPGHTYNQVTVITNDGTLTEATALSGYKTDGQLFAPSFVPSGIFSGGSNYYHTGTSFPSLAPGDDETVYMNYSVPTFIPLGTAVVFKDTAANTAPISNWLTDYSPWNNVNYFTTYIVSSYDPNFKEVSPRGSGATGKITYSDSVLEYMVHFQNTGTAPAENIVVVDTLDNNLDWTTLRPVYECAPSKVTLKQVGTYKIATFTFLNINLPPSSQQPITSNGMFTYTIHTRHGLPVGTTFKNRASIYFDYNAPILTNSTINTLVNSITGVEPSPVPTSAASSFDVYPNPASQSFNAIINSEADGVAELKVTDVTGKVLISKSLSMVKGGQMITTDVNSLTPGIYFVSLSQNGNSQTQKLVIMK